MTKTASKTEQCIELLEIVQNPTPRDFERISTKVNCSVRTVYRAHKSLIGIVEKSKRLFDKLEDIVDNIKSYYLQCPKCATHQEYQPIKKLTKLRRVYCFNKECRRYYNVMNNIIYDPNELSDVRVVNNLKLNIKQHSNSKKSKGPKVSKEEDTLSKITEKPLFIQIPHNTTFFEFCEKYSYPPYAGLFKFQKELHNAIWNHKYGMIRLPRDHGKSIYLGDLSQAAVDGCIEEIGKWDILYLGWTDQRKNISEFVYNYMVLRDEIQSSKVKQSSPYHFRTKKGGKFDTYSITSKDTLGFHGIGEFSREYSEENDIRFYTREYSGRKLLMIIDDPIDITFKNERHKERNLERKWNSTLANINPDMIIFTGTHKFVGDFLFFIDDKYKDEDYIDYTRRTHLCTPYWWDLFPEIRTKEDVDKLYPGEVQDYLELAKLNPCYNPNLLIPDTRFIPNAEIYENILCPERWYENELDPNYIAVKQVNAKKAKAMKDLEKKRKEVGEYSWHSEYEQNPHPITGDVWKSLKFEPFMKNWTFYDILVISLDRATTQNPKSSYTGYTCELRERESGERVVINDFTRMWEFEALKEHVNNYIVEFHETYRNIQIYLVIEKQGGGDDFISSCKGNSLELVDIAVIIPVHNSIQSGKKKERIKNFLYAPLYNERLKFLEALRNCETVDEILSFPNNDRIDGMDALANAENQIAIAVIIPSHQSGDENLEALRQNLVHRNTLKERGFTSEFDILRKDPYFRAG